MNAPSTIRVAIFLFGLLAGAAGCAHRPPRPASPAVQPSPVPEKPAPVGRVYEVEAGQSLLTILVYRSGPMAKAGHNHVIASHDLTGRVYVPDDLTQASFELRFPVAKLSVDEPPLRALAGPDFAAEVPEAARAGTQRHMLGPDLLDAQRYPEIILRSQRIVVLSPTHLQAEVSLTVHGQTRQVSVPLHYELDASSLSATGELSLKQTDLGLQPFSVMLGALQVQDEIGVRFGIRARYWAPNSAASSLAP